ncbi:HAD-IIIA family hydrolase [Serpentinicella alkaliphila]|uniref:Phosphoglycolate phosphatase n=1 Tax=Serpentinicella alkaliphila TaxID=1734049 RepID=A0A4R2TGY6_9FIRM|nr:HAD-IIIA family hydrolase [Serpentinicella alkaliphila]QUH26540.1 HAD-IIIA family hydrolase [Serpentinicella alkaliphila]TCP96458.1 phosphoglycolate phosphatase [Serpentinicella alkaliphila]
MKKYIIFDFDGTLADSENIVISVCNQMAAKHNFSKIKKEDIEYLRGLSLMDKCKFLNVPAYKLPFWAVDFYGLFRAALDSLRLFDGIKELLEELNNKGYNLAIISSNSEDIIREFLKKNEINYFNKIYCSSNLLGKDKVIRSFLKKYNIKNSDAIYVGDELRDIVASKKNDLKVIWVDWGFDKIDVVKYEKPDFIVSSPKDILDVIENID